MINFSHFSIILVKFLMILRLSLGEYIILLIKIITLHLRDIKCNSEKAMAPHSSTLAWKTPWIEEPGRLQSMGSLGVGYDWATSLSLFTFMHGRRKWQPTPVFLPGESQGQGSLPSLGLHRVGHDWSDLAAATAAAASVTTVVSWG